MSAGLNLETYTVSQIHIFFNLAANVNILLKYHNNVLRYKYISITIELPHFGVIFGQFQRGQRFTFYIYKQEQLTSC